ncbi:hypothetical protein, partial [Salmonella enterica]
MSIKTFIFSQPDKPIVKEKKEIDQTYKKFRFEIIAGFAPIFPDICYHLTHYKP